MLRQIRAKRGTLLRTFINIGAISSAAQLEPSSAFADSVVDFGDEGERVIYGKDHPEQGPRPGMQLTSAFVMSNKFKAAEADHWEPDPELPGYWTCYPREETVDVCERQERIVEGCEDVMITQPMMEEAAKHEELKDEYERKNSCISTDPACKAKDATRGGIEQTYLRESELDTDNSMPAKLRFHLSVTESGIDKERADMALAVHKGFRRDPVDQHMIFEMHDHQQFNGDAEAVALVQKDAADKERAELVKQSLVLTEMAKAFEANKDKLSAHNSGFLAKIAQSRGFALEAISCELTRMAARDQRVENKMKALVDMRAVDGIDRNPPGGERGKGSPSDISGTGKNPGGAVPPGGSESIFTPSLDLTKNKTGPTLPPVTPTASGPVPTESDAILNRYGADPDKYTAAARAEAESALGAPGDNDDLFLRVHRRYREKEGTGNFIGSILD